METKESQRRVQGGDAVSGGGGGAGAGGEVKNQEEGGFHCLKACWWSSLAVRR